MKSGVDGRARGRGRRLHSLICIYHRPISQYHSLASATSLLLFVRSARLASPPRLEDPPGISGGILSTDHKSSGQCQPHSGVRRVAGHVGFGGKSAMRMVSLVPIVTRAGYSVMGMARSHRGRIVEKEREGKRNGCN